MSQEVVSFSFDGCAIQGLYTAGTQGSHPLLVALHGAAYDARYFDAPGSSVHDQAHEAGWSFLSLTRPGYPATRESATAQPDFSTAARILTGAIGEVWQRYGRERPGIVLIGHSVGAALAVHIGARRVDWPLLGLAISGVGDQPAATARRTFARMDRNQVIDMSFAQVSRSFYSPEILADSNRAASLAELLVPFPSADVVEVNSTWCEDVAHLAPKVTVPVHYTLAQNDALWDVSEESIRRFGRHFSSSPRVFAQGWPECGHNIEHHPAGRGYVDLVLEFARRCCGPN